MVTLINKIHKFTTNLRGENIVKIKIIILLMISLVNIFSQNLYAQKSSVAKERESLESVNYVFVLQIDAISNVTLTVQDAGFNNIGSISDTSSLTDFFLLLNNSQKRKINPNIIVKADPGLNFGSVVDFLKKSRRLSKNIKLETSKNLSDPFVFIPQEPKNSSIEALKPNPNTLVVQITSDRKITLNTEEQGNLYDISKLTVFLTEIFQEREDNGVYREGTNEVEKTVYIKAAPSLQFSELILLVNAIKQSGASPVGLQIDDLTPSELPLPPRK